MKNEIAKGLTNVVTSVSGVASSWWLWLTDPNAAHVITLLTAILIISQLIWGWRKFLKGK